MDIFAGLEDLGIENIDIKDIYAEPEKVTHERSKAVQAEKIAVNEADLLFDKGYVCPVCDAQFKSKTVRMGKYRLVGTDKDLKPRYDVIEPLKYEVVLCNKCGFAATARYFGNLASSQKKLVKEKISANYKPQKYEGDTYSYEEALARYKLALFNSVIKISKASEKAYNCLKAGWLLRSYIEELELADKRDDEKIAGLKALQKDFLSKAYDGYITAMEQENFPISGMDKYTLELLLAVLAKEFGHLEVSAKLIADLLISRTCSSRIKDRARDLKEEILSERQK